MKLSKYINKLQKLHDKHGELDCKTPDENGFTFSDVFFTPMPAKFDKNGKFLKYTDDIKDKPNTVVID